MTSLGRWWRRLRMVGLLVLLLALSWWLSRPPPPSVGPERVAERFTRCGQSSGFACVVDGDSFHLGKRRIRIRGIDAPEREGACPAEIVLAERSAARLAELLGAGPFTMTVVGGNERDQYGRELRVLTRRGNDGRTRSIGTAMVEAGLAHDYRGHKTSWCRLPSP
ncbi:MAG: thermonuclease family protein [Sphingomicrobium sp.]